MFNIEWLLPSAISSLVLCQKMFEYRYVYKWYSPKTGRLAIGTAYHSAVAWAYRMKREKTPPALGDINDVFNAAWEKESRNGSFVPQLPPLRLQTLDGNRAGLLLLGRLPHAGGFLRSVMNARM